MILLITKLYKDGKPPTEATLDGAKSGLNDAKLKLKMLWQGKVVIRPRNQLIRELYLELNRKAIKKRKTFLITDFQPFTLCKIALQPIYARIGCRIYTFLTTGIW